MIKLKCQFNFMVNTVNENLRLKVFFIGRLTF